MSVVSSKCLKASRALVSSTVVANRRGRERWLHSPSERLGTTVPLQQAAAREQRILRSPIPDVGISRQTFPEFVLEDIERHYEDTALVCGVSGRSYTFGKFQKHAVRFASAITRRGFRKGDTFAIVMPNLPEFVVAFNGIALVGGITTTANPTYTSEEIARQLQDSNSKFVITVNVCAEKVAKAAAQCPDIRECFVVGELPAGVKCTPYHVLMDDDGSAFPRNVKIDLDDLLAMPFSSGTTGRPKGVMLTHFSMTTNILQMTHEKFMGKMEPGRTTLAILPFFHIFAMNCLMGVCLRHKMKIVTLPRFEPEMYINAIKKYKPNILHIVPPILGFLAKTDLLDARDMDSVDTVFCGAAPSSVSTVDQFLERIQPHHIDMQEGYGMTELSPVTHSTPKLQPKYGWCGVLVPNTEAKVVDLNTGDTLGPNQPGELYIRGPQVMKGYFNNEKATAETIDSDGWLHTGDIAIYDDDEYFKVIDRLKELIKVKGLQVSPSELEDILMAHPDIKDAAVIGVPDSRSGELPRAYVVPKNKKITEKEVEHFIAKQCAEHKHLKGGIEFVEEIPKTQTGKILHRVLKDEYKKKLELHG